MSYGLSFRWMKFALIAMVGTLAVSLPVMVIVSWTGFSEIWPLAFFLIFIPSAIWYRRRTARDRAEFEADRSRAALLK